MSVSRNLDKKRSLINILQLFQSVSKNTGVLQNLTADNMMAKIFFDMDFTDEESRDVIQFIKDNQLDNPAKLVIYIAQYCGACIDGIYDGIADIRKDIINQELVGLKTARDYCRYAIDNPKKKTENLKKAFDALSYCINAFEKRMKDYLSRLKVIDAREGLDQFIQINKDLKYLKENAKIVKLSMQSYLEALQLLAVIATELCLNIQSKFDDVTTFLDEMTRDHFFSFCEAYALKNDRAFWDRDKIMSSFSDIKLIRQELVDYFYDEQTVFIDLDEMPD